MHCTMDNDAIEIPNNSTNREPPSCWVVIRIVVLKVHNSNEDSIKTPQQKLQLPLELWGLWSTIPMRMSSKLPKKRSGYHQNCNANGSQFRRGCCWGYNILVKSHVALIPVVAKPTRMLRMSSLVQNHHWMWIIWSWQQEVWMRRPNT